MRHKACDYSACLSSNDLNGIICDLYENVMSLLLVIWKSNERNIDEKRTTRRAENENEMIWARETLAKFSSWKRKLYRRIKISFMI